MQGVLKDNDHQSSRLQTFHQKIQALQSSPPNTCTIVGTQQVTLSLTLIASPCHSSTASLTCCPAACVSPSSGELLHYFHRKPEALLAHTLPPRSKSTASLLANRSQTHSPPFHPKSELRTTLFPFFQSRSQMPPLSASSGCSAQVRRQALTTPSHEFSLLTGTSPAQVCSSGIMLPTLLPSLFKMTFKAVSALCPAFSIAGVGALHHTTSISISLYSCPKIQPSDCSAAGTLHRSEGFSPPQVFSQANPTSAGPLLKLHAVSSQKPAAVSKEPRGMCAEIQWLTRTGDARALSRYLRNHLPK